MSPLKITHPLFLEAGVLSPRNVLFKCRVSAEMFELTSFGFRKINNSLERTVKAYNSLCSLTVVFSFL